MKTKIVYVLVSDSSDLLFEQLVLSIISLRNHNEAHIIVVVDTNTFEGLLEERRTIYNLANEVISVITPEGYSNLQKSRFIKTNLREIISGDFLFIDCDTIVCANLSEIDRMSNHISAVADLNGELHLHDSSIINNCTKAGFSDADGEPYFNSGIMFVRDSAESHILYQEWHKQWLVSLQNGIFLDQPALCKANTNSKHIIHEIDGGWNCQVNFGGEKFLKHAKILHYAGGSSKKSIQQLLTHLRNNGEKPDAIINDLMSHPKTSFFTLMTIGDQKYCEYCNSEIMYFYFHKPSVFKLALYFAKKLMPLVTIGCHVKHLFFHRMQ